MRTNFIKHIKYDLKHHYQLKQIDSGAFSVINIQNNRKAGIIAVGNKFYKALSVLCHVRIKQVSYLKPDTAFFNLTNNTIYIIKEYTQVNDEEVLGLGTQRKMYQKIVNQISKEPNPTVEFCARFNIKNKNNYQDIFNILRIDGIKIFFDKYEDWWLGL
ncbi:hypothetical protein WR164_01750 [Philodulcilactobacillus myokoensis]|uniref:Uncharacterized protein n=1 Tax=Philodulcilactobacillus myokoensis TaxID=2929573 RepID=A0A9W6AZQ9_9LACO|nr:hypothetical protein [Philodulcilactobacillus myokoensis]GLB46196.1 hypothetical protein WR164_01750 [Philodulcilactobacillus myokoensis]